MFFSFTYSIKYAKLLYNINYTVKEKSPTLLVCGSIVLYNNIAI